MHAAIGAWMHVYIGCHASRPHVIHKNTRIRTNCGLAKEDTRALLKLIHYMIIKAPSAQFSSLSLDVALFSLFSLSFSQISLDCDADVEVPGVKVLEGLTSCCCILGLDLG